MAYALQKLSDHTCASNATLQKEKAAEMWNDILNSDDEDLVTRALQRLVYLFDIDSEEANIESWDDVAQLAKKVDATAAVKVRQEWLRRNPDPHAYPVLEDRYEEYSREVKACQGKPISVCRPLYQILTNDKHSAGTPDEVSLRQVSSE